MKISENTAISMPMRNLIAILIAVAAGVQKIKKIIEKDYGKKQKEK